nr:HNH endonuclease [Paenibacillus sp. 598K]
MDDQTPSPAADTPGASGAQGQDGEGAAAAEQAYGDESPAAAGKAHDRVASPASRASSSSTGGGRKRIVAEDGESRVISEPSASPESDKPDVIQEDEPLRAPRKRKRKRKRKGKAQTSQTAQTPSPGASARIKSLPADPKLPKHASLMQVETPDVSALRTTRRGVVWMRGRTEKGKRWHQETDLETAQTLVREHAAVILNPYTVQRLYSNKTFRQYILIRDRYTCYFCGNYGDTIDHLLPRAKGGHTTPLNCVCACNLCNQSKADRDMDEFMQNYVPPPADLETD